SVAIAIAGAIGITLLWVVDVLVYHELLIAAYIVGKRLERLYPWLPPIRSNFSFLTRGPAVRWYVAAFYLAGIAVVCLLGAGISLFWDSPDRYRLLAAPLAIGATLCAFIVLFTRRAIRKKDGVPDWTPQMSRPGA
ncbi:MAG TPA: hypothetical protein VM778_15140, partial [Gemmatimonadota bacterium]|nr:hypothetical protein [Gemmatimonadota bacterium]